MPRGTGRLLGAQIVGIEGAAKRIDIFATALHAGMSVQEMINLDLSYAPPYSNAWDPVLIAVRQADRAVNRPPEKKAQVCKTRGDSIPGFLSPGAGRRWVPAGRLAGLSDPAELPKKILDSIQ